MNYAICTLLLGTALLGTSCANRVCQEECPIEKQFTLGLAQREIAEGMSQDDVASALGSPNIVTKDASGKETWIYDKIAQEVRQSSRTAGLFLLVLNVGSESQQALSSQKSLTIVIKFNDAGCVERISYHSSKF